MTAKYELQSTTDENERLLESEAEVDDDDDSTSQLTVVDPAQADVTVAPDPRFYQPTPSPFKRAALLILIGFLFWLAFSLRRTVWAANKPPKIVHANRYSKDFKFRPAASPVITESLRDGRLRLRGAQPTGTPVDKPRKEKRKTKHGKRKAKQAARRK